MNGIPATVPPPTFTGQLSVGRSPVNHCRVPSQVPTTIPTGLPTT